MSNRAMRFAGLVSLAALATGCTTTLVTQGDPGGQSDLGGIPYRLPVRELIVDANWRLKGCDEVTDEVTKKKAINVTFIPSVKIKESLTEGEALVIDYQRITGPFKTGKLKVTYWTIGEGKDARATGFVKSINSEIVGQEAAAIKAGISAVGSLVGLATRVSGLAVGAASLDKREDSVPTVTCNAEMQKDINAYEQAERGLTAIAGESEEINRRLVVLTARIIDDVLPKKDKQELAKIKRRAIQLEEQRIALVTLREKLLPLISYTQSYNVTSFVKNDRDPSTAKAEIKPDIKKFGALVKKSLTIDTSNCGTVNTCTPADTIAKIADGQALVVQMALATPNSTPIAFSADWKIPRPITGKNFYGFVYREPVIATISVRAVHGKDASPLTELTTSFPQFGPIRRLPLRSRFAEKNGLAANFAEDGRPTDISYEAYEAGGVKAIEAVGQGLDGVNGAIDMVRKAQADKQAADDAAPLNALKSRIALLKAEDELAALRAAPSPESAARQAELERLQYQVQIAELEAKLKTLRGE